MSGRKRKGTQVVTVRTVETKDTTLAMSLRDDWANTVQARILHVQDPHSILLSMQLSFVL